MVSEAGDIEYMRQERNNEGLSGTYAFVFSPFLAFFIYSVPFQTISFSVSQSI